VSPPAAQTGFPFEAFIIAIEPQQLAPGNGIDSSGIRTKERDINPTGQPGAIHRLLARTMRRKKHSGVVSFDQAWSAGRPSRSKERLWVASAFEVNRLVHWESSPAPKCA